MITQVIAQENDCNKFYDYYKDNDFHNTIKSINECKESNILSDDDNIIFDYFLNVSYFLVEDDSFDAEKLEYVLDNSSRILGDLNLYLGYSILRSHYSGELYSNKNKDLKIKSLNILSDISTKYRDYKTAIELTEESLIKSELLYGKNEYYATTLHKLAQIYSFLGNYKKTLLLNKEALEIIEEISGKDNLLYATILGFTGTYYSHLGDKAESKRIADHCLNILKNLDIDKNNNDVISIYHNTAICYAQSDNIEKALRLEEEALKIANVILKKYEVEYALILNNISLYYSHFGNYSKSIEFGKQAAETLFDVGSVNDYKSALNNLAFYYLKNGEFSKSYETKFWSVGEIYFIQNQFKWLSEKERNIFWEKIKSDILELPYFSFASNCYFKFSEISYNSALLSKGILLQSSLELSKLILESGDEDLTKQLDELRSLQKNIYKLNERHKAESSLNIDSLKLVAESLEKELLEKSKEFGNYTQFMHTSWHFVQHKLGEKDVAIEFVEFPVLRSDSTMYAALVLRKDWKGPQMIPLFEKREIEQYITQSPDKQYSGFVGKQLFKLMWKPLEEVIEKGDAVHFSAAGVYHQLALEYLPSEDGTPLCDSYNFRRLSSTRQLAREEQKTDFKNATLYGGIQYDVNPSEMLAESNKYQEDESLYAYRGMPVDSLRGGSWVPLDNTVKEVEFISNELTTNKIKTALFTGANANEESIKALSGKKTNILHLATHGFFLPIEETRKVNYYQMIGSDDNPAPDMSMRRSGLIMAGGNRAWTGDTIPEGIDDGVLTAQEISVLDFREMDLVVLSACETGLGDIDTSEGVFGLQRAFKKAGAKTLIMSLWKVNDEVTKSLMNKFYQSLLSGKTKHEAFLEAQQLIRSRHPEPQNWAAFIMLD